MTLREIIRFEIVYQVRQLWVWFICAALLVFSYLMTRDGALAEALHDEFFVNSPFAIAKTTIAANLIWLLIAGVIAGEASARDVARGMHPLIYTTPVSKIHYLGGRFLAALAINTALLLIVQLGISLGVYLPAMDSEVTGPFRADGHITAFAYLSLPTAFAGTSLQFFFSSLSGRPMAAYLGSMILFFMSYIVGLILFLNGRQDLANLLDPVGVHFVLSQLSHLWTPTEKSWRLLSMEGIVLTNRLLWISVALAFTTLNYFAFRFRHKVVKNPVDQLLRFIRLRTDSHEYPDAQISLPTNKNFVTDAKPQYSNVAALQKIAAMGWSSFLAIATSWAGLAMLVFIPLMSVPVLIDQMESNGVPVSPTTIQVLSELTAPLSSETSRWVIVPLMIIFFAGELIWREREAGLGEINDTMPASEWTAVTGKFLGMAILLVFFLALMILSGIAAQSILQYNNFEPGLYAQVMFGLQLPEYLLFTVLALCLHVVANQKYIGHLLGVAAYVMIGLAPMFGLEHNLLIFGAGPAWSYTEMRGFGNTITPWLWFKLYWGAWSLLLAIVTYALWVRGKEINFSERFRFAKKRLNGRTRIAAVIGFLLVFGFGGFIFYNTNIINQYQTNASVKGKRAAYEKLYGQYLQSNQPVLTAAKLNIGIFPNESKVLIKGSYFLFNTSESPIDTIHVTTTPGTSTQLSLGRTAQLLSADEELGFHVYKLDKPLSSNDSIALGFELMVLRQGFTENGADMSIVQNGSNFSADKWCPSIGYDQSRGLMETQDRREFGLSPRPIIPSLYHRPVVKKKDKGVWFEAVVSTEADQVAVAPGLLREQWREKGRQYFNYVTDAPIGKEWSVFSASYTRRHEIWFDSIHEREVAIQLFHHPGHTSNIGRMLSSIRASLSYYTKSFGPYRHGHLTVVEHPGNGTGMHADATMISYSEGFSRWTPADETEGLDLPYAITAHEMAHQWTVPYASVEGAPVMSESIAWYYGLKAVEHSRGEKQLMRLLAFMREPYPYPPIRRGEPLLRGLDPYLSYRRGPFALFTLSEYVGEEPINEALKNLLARHRTENAPLATTLDLFAALDKVVPDSVDYLLDDLFKVNTYWRLQAGHVDATKTQEDRWEVSFELEAHKIVADSAGVETNVAMHDLIEIGVYDADGNALHLALHPLVSGRQRLRFDVPKRPAKVGVDPRHLLIDLSPEDNIRAVPLLTQ